MPAPFFLRCALITLSLAIACLSARAQASREIDLRPKFEKGQEIRYEMRTDSIDESAFSAGLMEALDDAGARRDVSRPTRTRTLQRMGLLLRVVDVEPEVGATVEMVVESVAVTLESNDVSTTYDSKKPPKEPRNSAREPSEEEMEIRAIRTAVDLMVGSKATFKIDSTGKITSLSLPSSLDQTALPAVLGSARPSDTSAQASNVGVPFNQIISHGHPTGIVRLREDWTNSDMISSIGVALRTHHKLRSATSKAASVDIVGVLTPQSENAKVLDADYEGSYTWDTEQGQLIKMDLKANVRIDFSLMTFTRTMTTGVRRVE